MSKERTEERTKTHARDSINRQATIEHLKKRLIETAINNTGVIARCDSIFEDTADNRIGTWISEVPSAQPERKSGKWIPHKEVNREYIGTVLASVEYAYWFCDACGYRVENGQPM